MITLSGRMTLYDCLNNKLFLILRSWLVLQNKNIYIYFSVVLSWEIGTFLIWI